MNAASSTTASSSAASSTTAAAVPTAAAAAAAEPAAAEEEELAGTVVDYKDLRDNTPKKGARRKRKSTSAAFGKDAVMRLGPNHPERDNFTHICTYPLEKNDNGEAVKICGKLLKVGYDQTRSAWCTTVAVNEMALHAESEAGKNAFKRRAAVQEAVLDTAFTYGMQSQAGADAAKEAGAPRATSGLFVSFTLTKKQIELSSAALMFVYSRQRISKAAFDDPFVQRGLRGSCSNRRPAAKKTGHYGGPDADPPGQSVPRSGNERPEAREVRLHPADGEWIQRLHQLSPVTVILRASELDCKRRDDGRAHAYERQRARDAGHFADEPQVHGVHALQVQPPVPPAIRQDNYWVGSFG